MRISTFCVAMLSNNSLSDKDSDILGKGRENTTKIDISNITNMSVKML